VKSGCLICSRYSGYLTGSTTIAPSFFRVAMDSSVMRTVSGFLALYPHAHIFVAGKDAFAAGNRQKAMSSIATGNYDAVIVSHKSFELLPVSDETFTRFVDRQKDQLEEAIREAKAEKGDNRRIVKELEKAKKRLETRLKERADRERKDDAVTFEQLGVDRLFVDEADLFKNPSSNANTISMIAWMGGVPSPGSLGVTVGCRTPNSWASDKSQQLDEERRSAFRDPCSPEVLDQHQVVALGRIVDESIAGNPKQVEQYKAGKSVVLGFLVSKRQANPAAVNELLRGRLNPSRSTRYR
jgi:hypothetical protein